MQTEPLTIDFLGALAGAGKTYRLSRYAHDRVGRGGKFLFTQPCGSAWKRDPVSGVIGVE